MKEKISLSSAKKSWAPIFLEHLGKEQVFNEYGGDAGDGTQMGADGGVYQVRTRTWHSIFLALVTSKE